ncbi:ABC transporter substrate-binding protein [Cohnella fermenti]|nr:ABC transporter substrate-binding protein [Cohnella fermenti]
MLTAERYLTLYDRFAGEGPRDTFFEATVEEAAAALYCTPRNAKLVLRKLEEERLVAWTPGRGRGNRSRIAFRREKEDYLLEAGRSLAERGDYKQALELLDRFARGTNARQAFMEWLNGHFGYQKIAPDNLNAKDLLRFPIFRPIMTLDPAEVNFSFDSHLIRQIYGRLVQFDEKQGKIVPAVAHTWTSTPDAMEWVFYLRKGVLFHDGRELTSSDVQYTFERLGSGKANSWIVRGVSAVETIGPRVVRFRLERPNRIFDRFLCAAAASILPRDPGGQNEAAFWSLPIGCGPFRLHSYSSHSVLLAAHSSYYAGRPYLDGVRIVRMPEECQEAFSAMPEIVHNVQSNRADPPSDDAADSERQQLIRLCNGSTLICWNMNRDGPHQSEAFRRAVRMILNPLDLIGELAGDRALPASSFRPEDSMAMPVGELDPERVRTALRESRYDGSPVILRVSEKYRNDADWIVRRLADWSVRAEVTYSSWADTSTSAHLLDADMTLFSIGFAEDEVCEVEFYEHGQCVVKAYLDPERDGWIRRRIDASLAADTQPERRLMLREVEQRLRDEAVLLFLFHERNNRTLPSSIRGASLNSLGWIDFEDIWLEPHE